MRPASDVSPRYRRYALGLLVTVYVLNFVDRQILAILLESIKRDLRVSDTQLGFLTGIAFALFYTFAGIPIARWADRGTRRTIIALGLAVWSAMTAASGLARSFSQLALARVGVGIGEAACSPPAHSLVSDYYPPERRATALAIYSLGIPVGVLFGFLAGGWIDQLFGWRTAFLVVGLPGLAVALVVRLTLREPRRGASEGLETVAEAPDTREVAVLLWRLRSFRHLSLAASLHAFVGYGVGAWNAAFLARIHGMSQGEIGTWLGLIAGIAGGLGTYLGGALADRLASRDTRWYLWLPAAATVANVPFGVLFYLWPEPIPALGFAIPAAVLGAMYLGPTFAMTQALVAPRMRAIAAAILLFIINLIGLGLGPQAVGLASDALHGVFDTQSLRYALLSVAVVNLWSALHYGLGARTLRQDLRRGGAATPTLC